MDRSTIIMLIIGGVLIIALLGVGIYGIQSTFKPAAVEKAVTNINAPALVNKPAEAVPITTEVTNINAALPAEVPVSDQEAREKADLERMAISFIERYGSFSNQSNFENILDLKVFMTQKMQNWVEQYIAEQRAKRGDTSIYFGITTKSLTTNFVEFNSFDGLAEILVTTQRREATGSTTNFKVYNQDASIKFLKENGVWKVNGIYWKI